MMDGGDLLALDEGGVASFVSSLGFPFYEVQIKEHGITGEVLVHLDHEAMRDVGIHSVGQRIAILKAVYGLKVQQNIPIEEGHYIPPSDEMEQSVNDRLSTSAPHQQLLGMLGERDDRIRNLELEVQRLQDTFITLREDGLLRASTKTRPPPAKSPTGNLFPHPLSNASTLVRSNSHNRPRPVVEALNAPESPRSPLDFSRLFVESPDDASQLRQQPPPVFSLHGSGRSEENTQPYSNEAVTPTTPTAPLQQQQQARSNDDLNRSQSSASHYLPTSSVASTSTLPPASALARSTSSTTKPTSSGDRSASSSDNPYRSFRVTLDDPCHKVLPAALKKYKINDDWRQYALFICYGNTERCLSYDEKPLLLFQKLKDANANPVFMLRHIKDIKSPIAVASAKHAARREKRSVNAGMGLDKVPTVNRDGSNLLSQSSNGIRVNQSSVGKDREKYAEEEEDSLKPKYCISIYPYLAEREDEFDVAVGDSFSIISKTKGWWVVNRDFGPLSPSANNFPRKCAWVPAGCLLETSVPPLSLADPNLSPPLANASTIPILPSYIISVSTPGIALMDYAKNGSDELDVAKGTSLRILKRYNHWSYAIKEDSGERGWIPSWFVNKPARNENGPITPPTGSTSDGRQHQQHDKQRSGSGSAPALLGSAPTIELDGIGGGMKNVFDIQF